jgi:fatty acid desaturase
MNTTALKNDFAELRRLVAQEGLMSRQPVYFTYKIIFNFVLVVIGLTVLFLFDSIWIQILNAFYFAFVYGQLGLLGHDAGHHQIFGKAKRDLIISRFCASLVGISTASWVSKHNEHHAHPNHEDMDPDIEIPILAFTEEQAQRKRGIAKFIVRHQAWFFFPALCLTGLSLRMGSMRYLLSQKFTKVWLEYVLLALHFFLYVTLVFAWLPLWTGVVFVLIHQAFFGLYMGSVFAPNHKGMMIVPRGMKIDFLRSQILTARNVRAHPFTDFWYGGLNFQIEHHLFPNMPRNKLRKAQEIVKEFCKKKEIPYHETSVFQSYREIIADLHQVSAVLRRKRRLF